METTNKCKVCDAPTEFIININLKAVPICDSCATRIMFQQINYLVVHRKD